MEMFTQRAHWVLSPRGRQVHSLPHGCGCVGDRRWKNTHSPLPHTSMVKDTTSAASERSACCAEGKQTLEWEAGEVLLPLLLLLLLLPLPCAQGLCKGGQALPRGGSGA